MVMSKQTLQQQRNNRGYGVMNVIIIGAGISGRGALRLAQAAGLDAVMVSDGDSAAENIIFTPDTLTVVSPGVRVDKSALLQKALSSGSRVISEMAFGFEYYPGAVLAITGTNGKTTATELAGTILRSCGYSNAPAAGNIGLPLSEIAAEHLEKGTKPEDVPPVALEVSSFQLEYPGFFAPLAAVILNCASDHLDRHNNSLEEYRQVKYRIFDYVLPENRITMRGMAGGWPHCFACDNGVITLNGKKVISMSELSVSGAHNEENLLAALELTSRFLPPDVYFSEDLRAALRNFRTGKHRIEFFAEYNGIKFYDDSKATNPAAVKAAVDTVPSPVRLLAGGLDKDMDFSELEVIHDRVKKFYLIGEAAEKISHFCGKVPFAVYQDLHSAVYAMCSEAEKGESVLLSPACASMDMFKNYAERGERFKEECMNFFNSHKVTGQ